jgi:hypothetical protein
MVAVDRGGGVMRRRRREPVVSLVDVPDGAVLLDETTGAFFHLNPIGALAYHLLYADDCTFAEAATVLAFAFAVDEATVREDLRAFVDALARKGLVS